MSQEEQSSLITLNVPGVYKESKTTNYKETKISNGYGCVNKAGITLESGMKGTAKVSFQVTCVLEQDLKEWLDKQKGYYNNEQWNTIEENWAAGGFAGGVLASAFGLLLGGGSANHYKNAHDKTVTDVDMKKQGFLESLHQVTETNATVTGEVSGTGTRDWPVTGLVFIELTTVKFSDGSEKKVINTSNPILAEEDGTRGGIKTDPGQKVDIIPI